jgi:hypothetical protein
LALALAVLVLVGLPAKETSAAPESQVYVEGVIPYYTDWLAAYQPAYVVAPSYYRPYYTRPYRSYQRVYRAGYSACWYYYC